MRCVGRSSEVTFVGIGLIRAHDWILKYNLEWFETMMTNGLSQTGYGDQYDFRLNFAPSAYCDQVGIGLVI